MFYNGFEENILMEEPGVGAPELRSLSPDIFS
jgi:hypothetical protein